MATESKYIEVGTRVYGIDGEVYSYVVAVGDRHVVRCLYGEDDGESEGDDIVVDRVFSEPPTQQRSDEIARLDALIAERQQQLSHFDAQARELRRTMNAKPEIAALVDLLAQKPVYFVSDQGAICVTTEALMYSEFVMEATIRGGDMHFWIKLDRDGSSSSDCGRIFQTKERAIGRVKQLIAEWTASGSQWDLSRAITAAKGAGIEPPEGAADKLRVKEIAEADKAVATAKAALALANSRRAVLDGAVTP